MARLLCLLLLTLVAGCSATQLAYNQLDRVTVWYLNGFFDLNPTQQAELRERVARQHAWHRQTQLPQYAAFCAALDEAAGDELSAEYFEQRFAELAVFWVDFMTRLTPEAAGFFSSFSDEQVAALFEKLEENNRELSEEYSGETAALRRERRERAIIRFVSRLTGRLNREQQAIVQAYSTQMNDISQEWLKRRADWQLEFRAALDLRADPAALEQRLYPLLVDPDRNDPPEYRALVEENQQLIFEMLATLSSALTPRQHERFRQRLRNYARDFELLAGLNGP